MFELLTWSLWYVFFANKLNNFKNNVTEIEVTQYSFFHVFQYTTPQVDDQIEVFLGHFLRLWQRIPKMFGVPNN